MFLKLVLRAAFLLDGAMLFNAAYFQNTTDGMLISSIVNAGSRNVNTDAEINGFEGNLLFYMNETTSVDLTWLKVDSEITALSLINPVNILTLLPVLEIGLMLMH